MLVKLLCCIALIKRFLRKLTFCLHLQQCTFEILELTHYMVLY